MPRSTMAKTGGVWTILSGLFLLFIVLTETNVENSALEAITPFILLGTTFGAVGIYALGGFNKAGRVGLIAMIAGSVLTIAGISLVLWLNNNDGWLVMAVGMLLHSLGWLIFGVVNYGKQVLPRGNGVPLIIGVVATVSLPCSVFGGGVVERVGDTSLLVWGMTLSVGWILLGVILLMAVGKTARGTP